MRKPFTSQIPIWAIFVGLAGLCRWLGLSLAGLRLFTLILRVCFCLRGVMQWDVVLEGGRVNLRELVTLPYVAGLHNPTSNTNCNPLSCRHTRSIRSHCLSPTRIKYQHETTTTTRTTRRGTSFRQFHFSSPGKGPRRKSERGHVEARVLIGPSPHQMRAVCVCNAYSNLVNTYNIFTEIRLRS